MKIGREMAKIRTKTYVNRTKILGQEIKIYFTKNNPPVPSFLGAMKQEAQVFFRPYAHIVCFIYHLLCQLGCGNVKFTIFYDVAASNCAVCLFAGERLQSSRDADLAAYVNLATDNRKTSKLAASNFEEDD